MADVGLCIAESKARERALMEKGCDGPAPVNRYLVTSHESCLGYLWILDHLGPSMAQCRVAQSMQVHWCSKMFQVLGCTRPSNHISEDHMAYFGCPMSQRDVPRCVPPCVTPFGWPFLWPRPQCCRELSKNEKPCSMMVLYGSIWYCIFSNV